MLDLGWSELVIIGVLALIIVGPKDLPILLRTLGRWVGRARAISREFTRMIDDAANEAELADLKRKVTEDVTTPKTAAPEADTKPSAPQQPPKDQAE